MITRLAHRPRQVELCPKQFPLPFHCPVLPMVIEPDLSDEIEGKRSNMTGEPFHLPLDRFLTIRTPRTDTCGKTDIRKGSTEFTADRQIILGDTDVHASVPTRVPELRDQVIDVHAPLVHLKQVEVGIQHAYHGRILTVLVFVLQGLGPKNGPEDPDRFPKT
jgi:hypothetical protein